ncbi:MAG: hypothetical protein ABIS45_01890 [Burkholderiales bacterium]
MHKLLAAIVASTFAFASVSFAAETVKKEELTQDQRADMRTRADQLTRARAADSTQVTTRVAPAPKAKMHQVKKSKKVSRTTKKTQPKA